MQSPLSNGGERARRKLGERADGPRGGEKQLVGRSPLIKLLSNTGSMASVLGQVITSSRGGLGASAACPGFPRTCRSLV
jgi:hypothetical protein